MEVRVSILMPVYGVEQYIEASLSSALEQTYADLEVVLVDDCSKDRSMELAQRVIESHPRGGIVRIVRHQANTGLGGARNTGIDNATGKWIYCLDSDDTIKPTCIEDIVAVGEKYGVDFVEGNTDFTGHGGSASRAAFIYTKEYIDSKDEILDLYCHPEGIGSMWPKLIRRDFLIENHIRCQPQLNNEDLAWAIDFFPKVRTMATCNKANHTYTYNQESITKARPSMRILDGQVFIVDYVGRRVVADFATDRRFVGKLMQIFELLLRTQERSTLSFAEKRRRLLGLEPQVLAFIKQHKALLPAKMRLLFSTYLLPSLVARMGVAGLRAASKTK